MDVDAVERDVVRRAAERDDGHDRHRIGEKVGQRQRHGHQRQRDARDQLRRHDEELLRPVHLHQRAPQRFERPRQNEQRGPERHLRVADTEVVEHQRRHEIQQDQRKPHGEIGRRDPAERRYFFVLHSCYGFVWLVVFADRRPYSRWSSLLRASSDAPTTPALSPSFENLISVSLLTMRSEYLLIALLTGSIR